MSAPVFLAGPGSLDAYAAGDMYLLDGAEGRHAGIVQRRAAGEAIDVVDGEGVRLRCRIEQVDAGQVRLEVLDRTVDPASSVRLVLVQALAKGDRDELAIETATELGVDEVVPWQAERSIVVWRGDRAAKSRARWIAGVRAAAKQSRRARVPVVAEPVDGQGLVDRVRQVVTSGGSVLVLHAQGSLAISEVVVPELAADAQAVHDLVMVVGPEGGISAGELTALTGAGAQAVRLGPHVLRTSTAGPAAIAVLAQRLGRWA